MRIDSLPLPHATAIDGKKSADNATNGTGSTEFSAALRALEEPAEGEADKTATAIPPVVPEAGKQLPDNGAVPEQGGTVLPDDTGNIIANAALLAGAPGLIAPAQTTGIADAAQDGTTSRGQYTANGLPAAQHTGPNGQPHLAQAGSDQIAGLPKAEIANQTGKPGTIALQADNPSLTHAAEQARQALATATPPAAHPDKSQGLPQTLASQAVARAEEGAGLSDQAIAGTDAVRTVNNGSGDASSPLAQPAATEFSASGAGRAQITSLGTMVRDPQQVEQLIESIAAARESGRAVSGEMKLRNDDFGLVSLRLSHSDGELRAILGGRDHGIAAAAQTALAERHIAPVQDSTQTQQRGSDSSSQSQSGMQRDFGASNHGDTRNPNRAAPNARDDAAQQPKASGSDTDQPAPTHRAAARGVLA